jgi:hypothetical protein
MTSREDIIRCPVRIRRRLGHKLCSSPSDHKIIKVSSTARPDQTSHISPTITMASPLDEFMACLIQVHSLSTHVVLVSDHARIANHVIAHNGYRQPARPSRWAAEKKTQISPKHARIATRVIAHNDYRQTARPSRWAAEKKTQISPKAPSRLISPKKPYRTFSPKKPTSRPPSPWHLHSTNAWHA